MIREDKNKNKIASCLNVLYNMFKTPYMRAIYKFLIQKKNFNCVKKENQCLKVFTFGRIFYCLEIL
jgi:hypothetical protein